MDHGLLAIDVFPGVHGVDRSLFVPVIRRRDEDGVYIGR